MAARKALGRGLEALIPDLPDDQEGRQSVLQVPIDRISANPYQPRQSFDQARLDELARSILEKGVIQPVTVRRKNGQEEYELIAGERRLRAARQTGYQTIPAIVMAVSSPEEMMELSLIENIQRDDLNPIHEARAYLRLQEECHLTQEEVATRVGKNRTTVANTLRLLKLPAEVQKCLLADEITMGHARALLGLENRTEQAELCKQVVKKGLSVRKVEELVKKRFEEKRESTPARKPHDVAAAESIMQRILGTKVNINRRQHKGKIEIEFYSTDDLNRILELLKVRL
ncbi:MAG: ParB/RepB/Spo0J family partition protein [Gemmatimonadetes bacterium]|nr:ParB/RepB/Spo0J family partition protein [Gemmatimonadota bacterium]MYG85869.1 ParB/RepB/Spo0J family partition protein [Gemmatimonadota bacterium]MYJ89715.1 ParB/RepB/Spo0J family partition protein [Gemmatimonadota bacterium]